MKWRFHLVTVKRASGPRLSNPAPRRQAPALENQTVRRQTQPSPGRDRTKNTDAQIAARPTASVMNALAEAFRLVISIWRMGQLLECCLNVLFLGKVVKNFMRTLVNKMIQPTASIRIARSASIK